MLGKHLRKTFSQSQKYQQNGNGCYGKCALFVFITSFCIFNVFLGLKINSSCDNQYVLTKITAYYETLLHEKEEKFQEQKKKSDSHNGRNTRDDVGIRRIDRSSLQVEKQDENFKLKKNEILNNENMNSDGNEKVTRNKYAVKNTDLTRIKFVDAYKGNRVQKRKGLKVDRWFDICIQRTIQDQSWHPLFPKLPQNETMTTQTGDNERIVGSHFRRMYGYLYTTRSDFYDFRLLSRDGADVLLLDTGLSPNEYMMIPDLKVLPEVLHLSMNRDTMDYQDLKLKLSQMFSIEKHKVWVKGNRLYFIEIIQGGRHFAKYQLQWRLQDNGYKIITENNLMFTDYMTPFLPSRIMQKYESPPKYAMDPAETIRMAFHRTPILPIQSRINNDQSVICSKLPSRKVKIRYTYQGYIEHTENFLVYPKEHFHFTETSDQRLVINKKEALKIAHTTFDMVNKMYRNTLQLQHVVHIVINVNRSFKPPTDARKLYFVELDVRKKGDNKVYRTSHFVRPTSSGMCFMQDHAWKKNVVVNILTPIRNQYVWLKYLIQMLEGVVEKTNETYYRLVIIDNNSTDGNYKELLKNSRLKHLYLNMPIKSFNKVKALNHGLKHVTDDDSIAFVLDMHLQLPYNMFDRIRKLTIKGKTAFSPTLLKLACGEHEQFTEIMYSKWLDIGTGMMAMYKSDWSYIGGFNEKLFGKKWGGEDWEVIDRIFQNGLYLIHLRMARFYHIHHSKFGMWDGKKAYGDFI